MNLIPNKRILNPFLLIGCKREAHIQCQRRQPMFKWFPGDYLRHCAKVPNCHFFLIYPAYKLFYFFIN